MQSRLFSEQPWQWIASRSTGVLLGVLTVGILVRAIYLAWLPESPFDPWRHLALVRNLREGAGFTLFDGQPYLWYQPAWYYVAAAVGTVLPPDSLAAALSAMSVWLLYLAAVRGGLSQTAALTAATLAAACGPFIVFTSHYGSEAFAVAIILAGLAFLPRARRGAAIAFIGAAVGLGLTSRLNLAPLLALFAPGLRDTRRAIAFLLGLTVPFLAAWWRNHLIMQGHAWVFTWDGLATPTTNFNAFSTLFLQAQPDIATALRRLHLLTMPYPEWLVLRGSANIPGIILMGAGITATVLSRRPSLIVAGAFALALPLGLDRTLSSNAFRTELALFPVFFLAFATLMNRATTDERRNNVALLCVMFLLAGVSSYRASAAPSLEAVTPQRELLTSERYMVNSAFYHPEALIYRYPELRFIGLPLRPDQFAAFQRSYPSYRSILWHDVSVQPELQRHIGSSGQYTVVRQERNLSGLLYTLLEANPR